jgi:DNA-directed RNA polymerase I and III subunit RPAC1
MCLWLCGWWVLVSIESEGPYAPERLLPEAIKVMREKIANIKKAAEALLNTSDGVEESGEDVEMVEA